jgi:hypothetical protein
MRERRRRIPAVEQFENKCLLSVADGLGTLLGDTGTAVADVGADVGEVVTTVSTIAEGVTGTGPGGGGLLGGLGL